MPYFATLVQLSTQDHVSATLDQGDTGRPGVAEQMVADVGLELVHRGTATVINEWPDLEVAIRALCAAGPSRPAMRALGEETVAAALKEALLPLVKDGAGLRIASEFGLVVARVPEAGAL